MSPGEAIVILIVVIITVIALIALFPLPKKVKPCAECGDLTYLVDGEAEPICPSCYSRKSS